MKDGAYKQITIKRNYPTTGYNAADSWQTFFTGYAYVQIGQGREYFAAKQRHADLSALAQMTQYVHRVDETMRAYIDGQAYEIIEPPIGVRELNILELKLKLVR